MDALIAAALAKPSERPKLLQALMSGHLFIIASWKDPKSRSITIQDFYRGEQSFLPVFSDEAHFKAEIAGSGFEDKGVSIDASLFASILKGGELLILNPGSISPIEISASELKKLVDPARLPK
ncbi:MAG TPA: SseB family protein [Woeseiaceae bacterium]|nr:SseB family protein [Woeseiaceae bacterium]